MIILYQAIMVNNSYEKKSGWSNGVEHKQILEAAGYNYAEIQVCINELY